MTALQADPSDLATRALPDRPPSRPRPVVDPGADAAGAGQEAADPGRAEHPPDDLGPGVPGRDAVVPEPLGPASGYADRLVVLDPWQHRDLYWGRDKVRRTVLAMTRPPAVVAPGQLLVPRLRDGARFWAMVAADGRSLALSTGGFLTLAALRADASTVIAHLDRLTTHPVRDPDTGLRGAWFALDARVVAVSGIAWRDDHDLDLLLKALRRCTRWGPTEPGEAVTWRHPRPGGGASAAPGARVHRRA